MIPKCTNRDFLRYRYGKYQEIPTDTDRKIPIWYTTLILMYNAHKTQHTMTLLGNHEARGASGKLCMSQNNHTLSILTGCAGDESRWGKLESRWRKRKAIEENRKAVEESRKPIRENWISCEENQILGDGNYDIGEGFHDISQRFSSIGDSLPTCDW